MALCNVQDLYVKTGFILRSLVKLRDYLLDVQNGSTKPVLEDVKTLWFFRHSNCFSFKESFEICWRQRSCWQSFIHSESSAVFRYLTHIQSSMRSVDELMNSGHHMAAEEVLRDAEALYSSDLFRLKALSSWVQIVKDKKRALLHLVIEEFVTFSISPGSVKDQVC